MAAKERYKKWLEPENLVLIEGWRRDGLTIKDIADNMHISVNTLKTWRLRYEPISTALKIGAEVSSYKIENAAYKSAMGFHIEEMEIIENTDRNGEVISITKKKHRRYIPPNTAMIIFILKNRLSDKWKDTRTIENKSDGQLAELIDGLKEPEKKGKENEE